ncbi:MFS transporter [Paractinoplanes globisporus]|uniref:MFS transporter n=1 Tax=Paractinoplanes globisporus TaxID=113565 RepID=A0ABW6WLD6_9ACTN|nr:MFS transporter [Actinoplanes globisporus]
MSPYRLYLLVCGLGSFAARTAFTLNLVYQATVVGLSPLQLVLVGTVMEGVCFVAQVPTGVIADVVSRRLSVIVGYLLMGAGLLVWGLFPSFTAILVANVIWSIGAVCVDGAEEAWAADEIEPDRVTSAFVRGGQLAQAGSLLGILAAVGLASFALAVPIVAGGLVTVALGVLLMVLMKEERWAPSATTHGSWRSMRRQVVTGGRAVRGSALLAGIVAGTFFAGLSSEGFDRLSQPFLLPMLGDRPIELVFGGLAMIAALGSIVATGMLGRRLDTTHPRRVGRLLAAVNAVTAAGMIAFGLSGQWWVAVPLYLLVRLLRDTADPIMNVWLVAATGPESRATVFSIQAQADALGQIAGGPPVGVVAQRRSLGAGLSVAGLFLLPAVALFALAARRSQPVRADVVVEPLA